MNRKTAPFPQLARGSFVPLYRQIQQRLLGQIQSGALKPGEPLPSTQEIAARLGVSQMTVRQAIKSLCELGIVYSRQGKGTFVSGIKLEKDFRQVLSFSEDMRARGSIPRSKVLAFEVQQPSAEVMRALRLHPGEKIIRLKRVRQANNLPMGIECSSLPLRICPDLLEVFDPRTSLYGMLAAHYGIDMMVADEVAEAGLADAEAARLLRVAEGSPVFFFTRISYVQSGQPIEFVQSTYRGDRYKIANRLTRVNRSLLESSHEQQMAGSHLSR
jgi:GntR family transcriptional regulator, N-acetylglucosamine utilization regulator